MKKNLCLYHADCLDGFTAMTICRKYHEQNKREIDCIPQHHQETPFKVEKGVYNTLYLVDFSYKRDYLIELAEKAKFVTILDHHKTAQENLVDLPKNVETIFNISKSGAVITWEFFYNKTIPAFVQYVQDFDLWKFELPHTKPIIAWMESQDRNYSKWVKYLKCHDFTLPTKEGQAILRYQDQGIKKKSVQYWLVELDGHTVPMINCTTLISQTLAEVCKNHPFAIGYFDKKDKRVFSLRSDKNGEDVSEVAKKFGGGGHKHAAGFTIQISELDLNVHKIRQVAENLSDVSGQEVYSVDAKTAETLLGRPMVFFISGHLDLSQEQFNMFYKPKIDVALKNDKSSFVIGDAKGCDSMAQHYLIGRTDNVTVFHMLEEPRNNKGNFDTSGGFESDEERDSAMTELSDVDIAWINEGREGSGTAKNLDRRKTLTEDQEAV